MIMSRLEKLALSTCKADPRSRSDRMADALFATVMGREFYCQCPNDPKHQCTAEIVTLPADQVISGVDVKIVMHVIADQATVEGRENNPGFLDGHGVISADHVRDIADREETIQRPMGNKTAPARPESESESESEPAPVTAQPEPARAEPDPPPSTPKPKRPTVYMRGPQNPPIGNFPDEAEGVDETATAAAPFMQVVPLPSTQPGDRYRPSAVLDSYIRIRDCHCSWPGCNQKAWGADLDHTYEYNHDDPAAGGCTHYSEMKTLCRFHHLIKTCSDWLDDQQPDPRTGNPRLIFTSPGRLSFSGVRVDRRRSVPNVEADRLRQRTWLTPSTRGITAITERVPHRCQTRTPPARTTDQPEATRTTGTNPRGARRRTRKERTSADLLAPVRRPGTARRTFGQVRSSGRGIVLRLSPCRIRSCSPTTTRS